MDHAAPLVEPEQKHAPELAKMVLGEMLVVHSTKKLKLNLVTSQHVVRQFKTALTMDNVAFLVEKVLKVAPKFAMTEHGVVNAVQQSQSRSTLSVTLKHAQFRSRNAIISELAPILAVPVHRPASEHAKMERGEIVDVPLPKKSIPSIAILNHVVNIILIVKLRILNNY